MRWLDVVLLLFAVVLFAVGLWGDGGMREVLRLRSESAGLRDEIKRLEAECDVLSQRVERLQRNDPEVVEREARRLGMVKPGETVFLLPERIGPNRQAPYGGGQRTP